MKRIVTFGTVEDFWCTWAHVVPPSSLQNGSNYHLFKAGIEPAWEDAANVQGGKWVVQFPKGKKDSIDEYWLHTLMAVLGETFDDYNEINGCVVSMRKHQSKLSLWTRTATDSEACLRIGQQLREILNLDEGWHIGYVSHQDSMKEKVVNRYEI